MKVTINKIIVLALMLFIGNLNLTALTEQTTNSLPDSTGIIHGVECELNGEERVCYPSKDDIDEDNIAGRLESNDQGKLSDDFLTSVKFDDNGVLFCTKHEDVSPGNGTITCTKTNTWNRGVSAGVAAIIKSVPASDLSTTRITSNYMIATYAINQFLYENNAGGQDVKTKYPLTTNDNTVFNSYMSAAESAKANSTDPTLTLSSNTLSFTKKDDKYVSNEITVNSNVDNYEVSSTSGVTINKNGNKFTVSIDSNDNRLTVGTPLKVDVSVTVHKSISQAKNYDCGARQDLTPANYETLTLTETTNISGQIDVNTSLVIKKVGENNKLLPGVTLKVESKENNYSQTFTTTNSEIRLINLKFGKYTITEVSAPEGYVKLDTPTEVTLSATKTSEEVILTNSLTKVVIKKLDNDTKSFLAGATLQIQDSEGNVVKDTEGNNYEWITTNESYVIYGLAVGKYYLVEVSAPKGYTVNTEKKEFEVTNENTVVEMLNKRNTVIINKISAVNKKLLEGAHLEIQDEEGNIVEYCGKNYNEQCKWVSTDKAYEIVGMPEGKYYLVETKAPEGYVLNNEKKEFEVDNSLIVEVEMQNNLEVKVPNTLSSRSALLITISMFDIFLGIGIMTYVKKSKNQE